MGSTAESAYLDPILKNIEYCIAIPLFGAGSIGAGAQLRSVTFDQGPSTRICLLELRCLPGVFFYEAKFTPLAQAGNLQGAKDTACPTFVLNFLLLAQFFQALVILGEQAVVGTDGDGRHRICFHWVAARGILARIPKTFYL